MQAPGSNPAPPEGINAAQSSGLGEFVTLAVGLAAAAAALTTALVLAAGWLAPHVPYEWERSAAAGVEPAVSTPDPDAEAALQRLAERLHAASGLPPDMAVEVHLSDEAAPNAFATLGGHVVVTRGLVESVSSENGLAMVLAHELAHVEHRHPIRAMSRGAVISLVWAALAGATGESAVHDVLGSAGLLTLLSFNREMERTADRDALAALRAHYGHVAGAGEFFRTLRERHDEPAWTTLLRTHPRTEERLAAIAERTREADGRVTPLPPMLRRIAQDG